ncbi:Nucleolin 2 [Leucoagaricus sp. SymC.cos]|nr:Nucleolin 2 [Leucoagaricus sp. SymC.cos]
MFSNLLRQQARLALPLHLKTLPCQQSRKTLLALAATPKSQVLPQRTFSISRALFEETTSVPKEAEASSEVLSEKTRRNKPGSWTQLRPRVLFMGNLPFNVEEEEVRELFSSYGEITNIALHADDRGRYVGSGHIQFKLPEQAQRVLESGKEEPFVLSDRTLSLFFAKKLPRQFRDRADVANDTIHIANYPAPGDERPLRELLKDYQDKILRVHFMSDAAGNFTPKTFVAFRDVEVAKEVISFLRTREIDGVRLGVYFAKKSTAAPNPRPKKPAQEQTTVFDA